MPAYKDEKQGTYYASFYYTDFTGAKRKKMKRGFAKKRDALEYERQYLLQKSGDLNMTFGEFVEIYRMDKKERIRFADEAESVALSAFSMCKDILRF